MPEFITASSVGGAAVEGNMGFEKGEFVQAEGKLVKWVEKGHYSPFGRN